MTKLKAAAQIVISALCAIGYASIARAEDDTFAKAGMRMIIGTGPGGSYDTIGRLVARHMGKHLPGNPNIVPMNIPGAGGLIAANNLYNLAAQDGSTVGVLPPEILFSQIFEDKNAQFDATKFNWLGNPFGSAIVVVVMNSAPIKNWRDATQTIALMGATGPNGPDAVIANLSNGTLGTRFRVVTGYKSGQEISLAMERGEVHGRGAQSWSGWKATNPDWVNTRRIVPLFQVALKPIPELPDVPALTDLVEGDAKALVRAYTSVVALQRPFATGPKVPAPRIEQLRRAFDQTMRDPQFMAEADQAKIELGPINGVEIQKMVSDALSLEPALVKQLKTLIAP